jgi:hypothetical protein
VVARTPGQAGQPAAQHEVLAAGQVIVHRGELPGEGDPAAHGPGLRHHVLAQHAGLASIGSEQGGEDPDRGGLAGDVRIRA